MAILSVPTKSNNGSMNAGGDVEPVGGKDCYTPGSLGAVTINLNSCIFYLKPSYKLLNKNWDRRQSLRRFATLYNRQPPKSLVLLLMYWVMSLPKLTSVYVNHPFNCITSNPASVFVPVSSPKRFFYYSNNLLPLLATTKKLNRKKNRFSHKAQSIQAKKLSLNILDVILSLTK